MSNRILITFCFVLIGLYASCQNVPEQIQNRSIYDFLDEMANEKLIDICSAVKPFTRTYIADKLLIVESKRTTLNQRQINELELYLREFLWTEPEIRNQQKEINLYQKGNSFWLGIKPLGAFYHDENFKLIAKPIWGVNYSSKKGESVRSTWGGAEFQAQIGKHLSVYSSLRDHSEKGEVLSLPNYLSNDPGGNYKLKDGGRSGGDYSEMRGGIVYNWKFGSIGLVKDHIEWGDNYNGSNIFSGRTPSFGMIKFNLRPASWLRFEYYHGWLVSEVIDSTASYYTEQGNYRAVYRNKFIAANMYSVRLPAKVWFSFGNSIIYSDMNVNAAYLIPFFFFKSIDHTLNHQIDNQNSQLFFNMSIRSITHLHLFGTLFIDEFSVTRISDPNRHNFIGKKIGFSLSNFPIDNVTFKGEYTHTNPFVYDHRLRMATFESNRYNLGHYLKDNSEEYFASVIYAPNAGLRFSLSYSYARHADDYEYIINEPVDEYPVLNKNIWDKTSMKADLSYQFMYNCFFRFGYEFSDIQGYDVDGETAQEYLDMFSPEFHHGKNHIIHVGFNIGF